MTRIRTTHIVILAVAACIAVGSTVGVAKGAGAPPPPPPPGGGQTSGGGGGTTSGGGGGTTTTNGGGGGTTTTGGGTGTPVSHPTPPMAAAVGTAATAPRVITVSWTLPKSSVITGVIVRRGAAANCPATTADGVGIGTTARRSSQVDRGVRAGATYCYSVFTTSPYKVSAAAHHTAVVGPPGRASAVVAKPMGGAIQIHWAAAARARPTTSSSGRPDRTRDQGSRDARHPGDARDGRAGGAGHGLLLRSVRRQRHQVRRGAGSHRANQSVMIPVAVAQHRFVVLAAHLVTGEGCRRSRMGVLLLAAVAFLAAKLIARAGKTTGSTANHHTAAAGGWRSAGMRALPW